MKIAPMACSELRPNMILLAPEYRIPIRRLAFIALPLGRRLRVDLLCLWSSTLRISRLEHRLGFTR